MISKDQDDAGEGKGEEGGGAYAEEKEKRLGAREGGWLRNGTIYRCLGMQKMTNFSCVGKPHLQFILGGG